MFVEYHECGMDGGNEMAGRMEYVGSARSMYREWERRYESIIPLSPLCTEEQDAALAALGDEISAEVNRRQSVRVRYGCALRLLGSALAVSALLSAWKLWFLWACFAFVLAMAVILLFWMDSSGVIVAARDFDKRFFGFYAEH